MVKCLGVAQLALLEVRLDGVHLLHAVDDAADARVGVKVVGVNVVEHAALQQYVNAREHEVHNGHLLARGKGLVANAAVDKGAEVGQRALGVLLAQAFLLVGVGGRGRLGQHLGHNLQQLVNLEKEYRGTGGERREHRKQVQRVKRGPESPELREYKDYRRHKNGRENKTVSEERRWETEEYTVRQETELRKERDMDMRRRTRQEMTSSGGSDVSAAQPQCRPGTHAEGFKRILGVELGKLARVAVVGARLCDPLVADNKDGHLRSTHGGRYRRGGA